MCGREAREYKITALCRIADITPCGAEDFAERNEGFGAEHTERLNFLVYEVEQVLVVLRVDFDEHVVLAGCEMAFNNFRDFFEFFNHCVELVGVFEEDADEGACVVTQCGGFDECA